MYTVIFEANPSNPIDTTNASPRPISKPTLIQFYGNQYYRDLPGIPNTKGCGTACGRWGLPLAVPTGSCKLSVCLNYGVILSSSLAKSIRVLESLRDLIPILIWTLAINADCPPWMAHPVPVKCQSGRLLIGTNQEWQFRGQFTIFTLWRLALEVCSSQTQPAPVVTQIKLCSSPHHTSARQNVRSGNQGLQRSTAKATLWPTKAIDDRCLGRTRANWKLWG